MDKHVPESVEWVQLLDPKGKPYCWNRRAHATSWNPPEDTRVACVGEKGAGGEVWYWHNSAGPPSSSTKVIGFGVWVLGSHHLILDATTFL